MGKIKAKLTEMLPQPIPIKVDGFDEILVFPLTLEEQATITAAQADKENPGRSVLLMAFFTLRKVDPDLTMEDVNKMDLTKPENNKLIEEIGKVMAKFSSFRSGSPSK